MPTDWLRPFALPTFRQASSLLRAYPPLFAASCLCEVTSHLQSSFPSSITMPVKTVLSPLCRMWQCLVSGLLTLLFPMGTPSLWFSQSRHFISTRHRRFTFVQLCFTYTLLTFSTAAFDSSTSVSVCWVCLFSPQRWIFHHHCYNMRYILLALLGTRCTTNWKLKIVGG